MWKLLIADDEPRIRRGLRNTLDWESLGIEIVGEAEDGEIALDMARKHCPDILLLDINMPFMNGLQLIEALNFELQNSLVIIISGYDDFEYIQKALRLKVFDYVLKPVDSSELDVVIKNAITKLNEDKEEEKNKLKTIMHLDENMEVIKNIFLNKLINNQLNEEELREQLSFFSIELEENSGVMVIKLLNTLGDEVISLCKTVIEAEIKRFKPYIIFEDSKKHIVVISSINKMIEWINLCDKLSADIKNKFNVDAIIYQEIIGQSLENIKAVYDKIIGAIEECEKHSPIVMFAKNYIDTYFYQQDLSLKEVAEKVGVSPDYLSRLLKRELGISFVDYVTKIRVEKAIKFMNDPSIKFYEIAEQVGYSTQHYFSTAFKKVMGISPLIYRKGGSND